MPSPLTGRAALVVAVLLLLSRPAMAEDAPSPAEAKAFVEKAEAELARESEYLGHVEWVQNTYIAYDTNWLLARANGESTDLSVNYAKEAARFDKTDVDPVLRRKLDLMKQALVLPAPSRPGAAQELAEIEARLDTAYSTGKFTYQGKTLTLDDMEELLRTSRDPQEIRALWEGWRLVSVPMKADYARLVTLTDEGARELGYADTGALWRSWYDMPPDAFARDVDRLWAQLEPFYSNLHCYVRARLNARYGDAVQPRKGPIRADLLGNMWGQTWSNIYDIVQPQDLSMGYDLTQALRSHGYDAVKMVKTGEAFYTSLGFAPLPKTFWERSQLTRPVGREVVCHASAWDVDNKSDIRLKACLQVNDEDFYTVHHELGHNMYQRAYQDQPFLFENGANDGFHEAIGDFAGLNALTPTYLHQLGLVDALPGHRRRYPLSPEDGPRQDRLPALRAAGRQMALAGLRRRGGPGAIQRGLVGAGEAVSGHGPAGPAPGGRLRSRRQIPCRRQHALCALLPGRDL